MNTSGYTFSTPAGSTVIIYRNEGQTGGSNQLISISDISFTC